MPDPLASLIPAAQRHWARSDPVLAALAREHPPYARAIEVKEPFEALVASLAHQQVSIAAGRAIFSRITAAAGGSLTAETLLAAGPDPLRAAGLSRPKVAYALDLAAKTASGDLDFGRLAQAPDAEVIAALTQVKGIGVWTAKMFLIFHLARPDVLPHEDLGVQIAVAQAYRVPRARVVARILKLAPAWRPYSSLAALTLWNWRRVTLAAEAAARGSSAASAPIPGAPSAGRGGSRGASPRKGDRAKGRSKAAGSRARRA